MSCLKVWCWIAVAGDPDGGDRGIPSFIRSGGWSALGEYDDWLDAVDRLSADGVVFWLPYGIETTGDFDLESFTRLSNFPATMHLEVAQDVADALIAFAADSRSATLTNLAVYHGFVDANALCQWDSLDAAGKRALAAANLLPMKLTAQGLRSGVTLWVCIDTLNAQQAGSDSYLYAVEEVRSWGYANVKIGGEPWPEDDNPDGQGADWLTIIAEHDIDIVGSGKYDRDTMGGIILPFVIGVGGEPGGAVRSPAALREFGYVAVEPHATGPDGSLWTYDALVSEACSAAARTTADSRYSDTASTDGPDAVVRCFGDGSAGGSGGFAFSSVYIPERRRRKRRAVRKRPEVASSPPWTVRWSPPAARGLRGDIDAFVFEAAVALRDAASARTGLRFRAAGSAVTTGDAEALVREYGTELRQPRPWAKDSIRDAGEVLSGASA